MVRKFIDTGKCSHIKMNKFPYYYTNISFYHVLVKRTHRIWACMYYTVPSSVFCFSVLILVHLMQSVLRRIFGRYRMNLKKLEAEILEWHNIGINNRINNSMVWQLSPFLVFLRAPKYYTARENHHLVPRVLSLVERTLGTKLVKPSSNV